MKSLMNEGKEIQKRMRKSIEKKQDAKERAFLNNMMLGKVASAARYINNEDAVKGVHELNEEIKEILLSKHPEARDIDPEVRIHSTNEQHPEPVIYEEITVNLVQKTAKKMKGSGGPTHIDADIWKTSHVQKSLKSVTNSMSVNCRYCKNLMH